MARATFCSVTSKVVGWRLTIAAVMPTGTTATCPQYVFPGCKRCAFFKVVNETV